MHLAPVLSQISSHVKLRLAYEHGNVSEKFSQMQRRFTSPHQSSRSKQSNIIKLFGIPDMFLDPFADAA